MSEIQRFTLSNGVRVLAEPVSYVRSAAIGLWCTTGSCNELTGEFGITHLIEHMLFKGTERRTAKEIAEAIEGRGGMLNAFTDKECTCYYCRVLSDDLEIGVDVLCDMVLHSLLDPKELKREKGVVLDEIMRSEDEPSDHVHELHLQERWGKHPLGRPIMGTPKSVRALRRESILDYMGRRYRGANVLVAAAGNLDPSAFRRMVEERLEGLSQASTPESFGRVAGRKGVRYHEKDIEQVHFCIGTEGCSVYDDDLHALAVLDAAMGGGMSSRLFQEVREKRGLAYSVGTYSAGFAEAGTFTAYGGTSPKNWPAVQQLVRAEFEQVTKHGLAADELDRTKRLISGNIVLSLEGMSSRMMRMSKNEIYHRRDVPVEETLGKIGRVTNDDVVRLASTLLRPELVSTTAIGPVQSGA